MDEVQILSGNFSGTQSRSPDAPLPKRRQLASIPSRPVRMAAPSMPDLVRCRAGVDGGDSRAGRRGGRIELCASFRRFCARSREHAPRRGPPARAAARPAWVPCGARECSGRSTRRLCAGLLSRSRPAARQPLQLVPHPFGAEDVRIRVLLTAASIRPSAFPDRPASSVSRFRSRDCHRATVRTAALRRPCPGPPFELVEPVW